jgi:hypothetical protein
MRARAVAAALIAATIAGGAADVRAQSKPLTWTAPAGWVAESPRSAMRKAQYRVPGSNGDGECVVFYFGPGEGGSAKDNADRWVGQFRRADGKPVTDAKTRAIKVGDVPVTMVEVAGTYVGGMGGRPGPEQPDQMLLGAIVEGSDANWFFRTTGPRPTVDAARGDFEKMIRSIKRAP